MRPISVHTTFLRVGAVREPVTYEAERAADGRSMTSRVVHAYQGTRLLSVSIASFQDPETEHPMLDHPAPIEPAPAPESLPTTRCGFTAPSASTTSSSTSRNRRPSRTPAA